MNNKKIYSISLVILSVIILLMGFRIFTLESNINKLIKNSEEQNRNLIYKLNDLERVVFSLKDEEDHLIQKNSTRDKKIMTYEEVAKYLRINQYNSNETIASIPHISVDGEKRFLKDEVDKWFTENQQASSSISKDIMNPGELSRYLGVPINDVLSWVEDEESEIPFYKYGGLYRFRKQDIDKWWSTKQ